MKINSNINIIGGIPDWNILSAFSTKMPSDMRVHEPVNLYSIKTTRAFKRFESAITETILKYHNSEVQSLVSDILSAEFISNDCLLLLFWNASFNDDLLNYLNTQTYFLSFYSGRISIKQDEVAACLKDLRESEPTLKKWSDSTLQITASKYLTLLKKFHLMQGSLNKTIVHPYLSDKMFVLFVYWINAIESKTNLLESEWLKYSFCERSVFIERLMHKKYSKYFQLNYTGDKLKIETTMPYENIYHAIN